MTCVPGNCGQEGAVLQGETTWQVHPLASWWKVSLSFSLAPTSSSLNSSAPGPSPAGQPSWWRAKAWGSLISAQVPQFQGRGGQGLDKWFLPRHRGASPAGKRGAQTAVVLSVRANPPTHQTPGKVTRQGRDGRATGRCPAWPLHLSLQEQPEERAWAPR